MARRFFEVCSLTKPQPRDNWHEPLVCDIPTLSIGNLDVTQKPVRLAEVVVCLQSAQAFLIPEAGSVAVLYQLCMSNKGVAFINNPQRQPTDSCAQSVKVGWYIPDQAGKEPQGQ